MKLADIHKKLTNAAQSQLLIGLPELPGGQRLLRYSIKADNTAPLVWVNSQNIFPKAYFQSREKDMEWAGCGSAEVYPLGNQTITGFIQTLERRLEAFPGCQFFCALPFQEKSVVCREWRPFGKYSAFLPLMECRRNKSTHTITCTHILKPGYENQWMDEIDNVIRSIRPVSKLSRFSQKVKAPMIHSSEKKHWVKILRKALSDIDATRIEKIVLSRKLPINFETDVEPLSIIPLFHDMKSPAYFFCFEPEPYTAFLGSSPERLFKRKEDRVWSEALAGTRKRGNTPEQDAALRESLLTTHKDLHEQALVFNHINRALKPLCEELQYADRPEVLRLIKVQHLISAFHGTLKKHISHSQIINALHPTPAVAGVPTCKARQELRKLEGFERGLFAGPLGLMGQNDADFTVAIRSGRLINRQLTLYAGAGIVEGSDPLNEWSEIDSKFLHFLQVLKLCR